MERTVPPIKKQSPSIEALARAVAQSPDGIAVLALDGEFLFANPAWVEMHGYRAEEIIGRRIQELYPDAQTARQAEEVMRQLASQDSYQVDINHAKRDGTPFQAWLSVTMLRDGAGTPNGLVLTARDTTKWNRLKAALESEKARLEHQYRRQEAMASIELAINEPNELSIVLDRIVTAATRLLPASGGISLPLETLPGGDGDLGMLLLMMAAIFACIGLFRGSRREIPAFFGTVLAYIVVTRAWHLISRLVNLAWRMFDFAIPVSYTHLTPPTRDLV